MKSVNRIDREAIPDCCMCCEKMKVESNVLVCDHDGVDTLPYFHCGNFLRLNSYGTYYKNKVDIAA